jgi:hypothetical protein
VADSFLEYDQVVYSLGHDSYVRDGWSGLLIKKELNTVLDTFAVELRDELFLSLDEHLGRDTDVWKEIDLSKTLRAVIAQAASRFTVGIPLCRLSYPLANSHPFRILADANC